jgi:hypothetical protein
MPIVLEVVLTDSVGNEPLLVFDEFSVQEEVLGEKLLWGFPVIGALVACSQVYHDMGALLSVKVPFSRVRNFAIMSVCLGNVESVKVDVAHGLVADSGRHNVGVSLDLRDSGARVWQPTELCSCHLVLHCSYVY